MRVLFLFFIILFTLNSYSFSIFNFKSQNSNSDQTITENSSFLSVSSSPPPPVPLPNEILIAPYSNSFPQWKSRHSIYYSNDLSIDSLLTEDKWQCISTKFEVRNLLSPTRNAFNKHFITNFNRVSLFLSFSSLITSGFQVWKEYTNSDGTNPFCEFYDGGCSFIGRGSIIIRGKSDYELVQEGLGIDCIQNPSLLENPETAIQASAFLWNVKNLNQYADLLFPVQLYYIIFGVWPDHEMLQALSVQYRRVVNCLEERDNFSDGNKKNVPNSLFKRAEEEDIQNSKKANERTKKENPNAILPVHRPSNKNDNANRFTRDEKKFEHLRRSPN